MRTWDIFTGHCKGSFKIPLKGSHLRDVKLIAGKLVFVWCKGGNIHIWDIEKQELLLEATEPQYVIDDIKISGGGSKVPTLNMGSINAWSICTGEEKGRVLVGESYHKDP